MNTRTRFKVCLTLLLTLLLAPALAEAEQQVSSRLLLPYFEVDMAGGLTTLFAVSNAAEEPASFSITVYTNWGIKVLRESAELEGGSVLTVNLSDWLVRGRLPSRNLGQGELEHLQAALSGLRSPQSDLFYGTEVAPLRAVGYIEILGHGSPKADSLWGDYFVADPLQNFAQGDSLISLDADCAGACNRHVLRFLAGGVFDGGTEVIVWTGKISKASETGFYREEDRVGANTSYFDMNGQLSDERFSGFTAVEVVNVSELGLNDPFGWLELHTESTSFVSVRYSAMNRFSVGLRSFCKPNPIGPAIRIEKATNGEDADTPTGPEIMVGDPVEWTYVVTNTGGEDLFDLAVTDDQGVFVDCPGDELLAGKRMTCQADGIAVEGQYKNVGTATGWTEDGTRVHDSDPSHYFGKEDDCCGGGEDVPAIEIEKATNGHDADAAPGPSIPVGAQVKWTYVVTNIGETALDDITVTDDQGVAVSCPETSLAKGESMTCEGFGTAREDQYGNVGTARGEGPDPDNVPVTDSDPSHYFGMKDPEMPRIMLEKSTNGHDADSAPGPMIPMGSQVTWTYQVMNTGNVMLTDVAVNDDMIGAISCPKSTLQIGESMTCTAQGTAQSGQYRNEGMARGKSPMGQWVDDMDPSHYYGNGKMEGCGQCHGKVTELSLQYQGTAANAQIEVRQKKDGAVVYNGIVQPGGIFSFSGQDKHGTLTTEIHIFVNGDLDAKIHTSCSTPIGPGLIRGDFEVVSGSSRNAGPLCPVDDQGGCDGSDSDSSCGGGDDSDSESDDSDSGSDDSDSGSDDGGSDDSDSDSDSGSKKSAWTRGWTLFGQRFGS